MVEKKPDPVRVAIVRMLPRHIKEQLTIDEMNSLLYDEVLPESLLEKLKDYLVDVEDESDKT